MFMSALIVLSLQWAPDPTLFEAGQTYAPVDIYESATALAVSHG